MNASDYSQGRPSRASGPLSQEGDRAGDPRVVHIEVRDEPQPAASHRPGEDAAAAQVRAKRRSPGGIHVGDDDVRFHAGRIDPQAGIPTKRLRQPAARS